MKRFRVVLHLGLWIALAVGLIFWIDASVRLQHAQADKARVLDYYAIGETSLPPRPIQYAALPWDKYETYSYRINPPGSTLVLQLQQLQGFEGQPYSTENFRIGSENQYEFRILKERGAGSLILSMPSRQQTHPKFSKEVFRIIGDHHDQLEILTVDANGDFPSDAQQIKTLFQWTPSPPLLTEHPELSADRPVLRIRVGTEEAFKTDGSFREWPYWYAPRRIQLPAPTADAARDSGAQP